MDQFDSKTFNTEQGHQDVPGGAVFFNKQLFYIVSRDNKLIIITCSPPSGQDNWSVVTPQQSNWGNYWKKTDIKTKASVGLSTPLVILPNPNGNSSLCMVGSDSHVYMLNQDMQSFTPVSIQSANGTAVRSCGATVWGNFLIIAWFNLGANMLMWDAYDVTQLPDPINSEFVWKPVGESGGIPGAGFPAGTILGDVLSLDWFTLGGNNFYLVTSFMSGGKTPSLFVTPMQNMVAQIDWTGNTNNPYQLVQNTGSELGITVLRDPGGRIRLYGVAPTGENGSNVVSVATIANSTDPFDSDSAWTQEFQWERVGEGRSANQPPVGCFLLGDGYSITEPASGTANDVYEIVLFSPDHDEAVWADISSFGTVQHLPNYMAGKLLLPDPPPQSYLGAVSGIIDSPFPIPASNIQNGTYSPNTSFGSVLFGATDTETKSHSANFSHNVGVSSTYETTAGFGPAWDIAYSNGRTSGEGTSDSTSDIQNVAVATQLDASGVLQPYGAYLANNVIFNYSWYRLVDLDGNWIGNGPVYCTIVPVFLGATPNSFQPYLVTPGDLSSYTRGSINNKAIALGLVSEGADYIADVIEANALAIGIGGANYMEYNVSYNAEVLPAYVQTNDSWEESGWTFNLSSYAGLSGGVTVSAGVSFIGEFSVTGSFTAETLAGVSLSSNHESTTDKSSQLQIQLQSFTWPNPVEPTDIAQCSFQLYYLPANQLWVQELVKVTGLSLDVNSRPWRILFVVDSYTTKHGTKYPSQ